eukprot:9479936-Pyramimonas_sp.AAC.1
MPLRLRTRTPEGDLRNLTAEAERDRADHRLRRVAAEKDRNNGTGVNPTVRAGKRARYHAMLIRATPRIAVELRT